jgi:hypothetical protein
MNWEVPAAMILVLTLAVEAILALRPIAEPASSIANESGATKESVEQKGSE